MIREWRQWQGTASTVRQLEEAEENWGYRNKINLAIKLAAKDGGAAILIGVNDGNLPNEPLEPSRVTRNGLQYMHVVSKWDLSWGEIDRDPMSPWFGQPREYRIFDSTRAAIAIHPSRVIPFVPIPRLDLGGWDDPWGDSVFERLHDPLRDAIAAFQGVSAMYQESKVDVIKIPNLSAQVGNDVYRQAVLQRFALANSLKSISNTLLMDKAEEWEQKTLSFIGHPEVLDRLLTVVAGAADMPVTRLLGRSPAGLNATGLADLEAYYNLVNSRQNTFLRPAIRRLDDLLVRSTFGRTPRQMLYGWRPLWNLAATDAADVNLKEAQAVAALAQAGVFDPRALAEATVAQVEEREFLPGLRAAMAANPTQPPEKTNQTPTASIRS
jgi:hypothetical protein